MKKLKKAAFAAIPVCFIICFSLLLYGVTQEKLKEKFIDLQCYLELMRNQVDFLHLNQHLDNEGVYHEILLDGLQYIDGLPHIFASLYDEGFEILSIRSPEEGTAPFDPRKDKAFMELAGGGGAGTIPIIWEDLEGGITKRTMHTCFRWVELPDYGRSYLMAAGVSSYSLASPSLNLFIGIVTGILLASLFLFMGFVIFIVRDMQLRFGRDK